MTVIINVRANKAGFVFSPVRPCVCSLSDLCIFYLQLCRVTYSSKQSENCEIITGGQEQISRRDLGPGRPKPEKLAVHVYE